MAELATLIAVRLHMSPCEALITPLSLIGHLVASIAKANGDSVSRKMSTKKAKELLKWAAKNCEQ